MLQVQPLEGKKEKKPSLLIGIDTGEWTSSSSAGFKGFLLYMKKQRPRELQRQTQLGISWPQLSNQPKHSPHSSRALHMSYYKPLWGLNQLFESNSLAHKDLLPEDLGTWEASTQIRRDSFKSGGQLFMSGSVSLSGVADEVWPGSLAGLGWIPFLYLLVGESLLCAPAATPIKWGQSESLHRVMAGHPWWYLINVSLPVFALSLKREDTLSGLLCTSPPQTQLSSSLGWVLLCWDCVNALFLAETHEC